MVRGGIEGENEQFHRSLTVALRAALHVSKYDMYPLALVKVQVQVMHMSMS